MSEPVEQSVVFSVVKKKKERKKESLMSKSTGEIRSYQVLKWTLTLYRTTGESVKCLVFVFRQKLLVLQEVREVGFSAPFPDLCLEEFAVQYVV